jgi:hypothetical protein
MHGAQHIGYHDVEEVIPGDMSNCLCWNPIRSSRIDKLHITSFAGSSVR